MARKSMLVKNRKRQATVDKYAKLRKELKDAGDLEGIARLPRNSNPNRVRNRCEVTGRPRSYMRKFGLSRMEFRERASRGEIPGITKSSW